MFTKPSTGSSITHEVAQAQQRGLSPATPIAPADQEDRQHQHSRHVRHTPGTHLSASADTRSSGARAAAPCRDRTRPPSRLPPGATRKSRSARRACWRQSPGETETTRSEPAAAARTKKGTLRHTSLSSSRPRRHQARPSNTNGSGATAVLLSSASTKANTKASRAARTRAPRMRADRRGCRAPSSPSSPSVHALRAQIEQQAQQIEEHAPACSCAR